MLKQLVKIKHALKNMYNLPLFFNEMKTNYAKVASDQKLLFTEQAKLVSNSFYELEAKITKKICVFNSLENLFPKNYYENFINQDLTERYKTLVSGLDEDSIKTVNRVLARIQKYAKYKQTWFETSDAEYKEIEKIRLIYSNGVELSKKDGIYAFNEFVLASDVYCASSLYYDCFLREISDAGRKKIYSNDIIDAGAFCGDSAIVLSKYTNKMVHAFEPANVNYKKLLKTLEINDARNVVPVRKGLGEKTEIGDLNIIENNEVGASFLKDYSDSLSEKVDIISIDDYVKENGLKIGFIKTDVEGFEQQLLKGAINTIKRDKPVLSISIYHTFNDFFEIKPWIEKLSLGYKFKVVKPAVEDICCDVILLCETSADYKEE